MQEEFIIHTTSDRSGSRAQRTHTHTHTHTHTRTLPLCYARWREAAQRLQVRQGYDPQPLESVQRPLPLPLGRQPEGWAHWPAAPWSMQEPPWDGYLLLSGSLHQTAVQADGGVVGGGEWDTSQ
jgi:hypothetical protein